MYENSFSLAVLFPLEFIVILLFQGKLWGAELHQNDFKEIKMLRFMELGAFKKKIVYEGQVCITKLENTKIKMILQL